jgi:hypothetical protein
MEKQKFIELSKVLVDTEGLTFVSIKGTKNPNIFSGVYLNGKNEEQKFRSVYYPEHDFIRISTDVLHFSDYTLETDRSMREFYRRDLDRGYSLKSKLNESSSDCKCPACGNSYDIVLTDENTISLRPGFRMRAVGDFNIECAHPNGPEHARGEIAVDSDMLFANFFPSIKDDCPTAKKYSDEFNLCSYSGRRNITEWKAKNQNVAYGQMGNMSLAVYVNAKKDHIILTLSRKRKNRS